MQPEDRFMVSIGRTLVVITSAGNVFGADILNNELQPVFQFGGAKIGFNPEDRFAVTIGNTILIITQNGSVFGSEVTGRELGPVFRYDGPAIGFNPVDKFMVSIGHLLVVITSGGSVFGALVNGRTIGPVSQIASGKIGFNPQDRFMVAMGHTLAVITNDGDVFGANVRSHVIGIFDPVDPLAPHLLAWNLDPVTQFGGAKIGFNPQDRFMVAMGQTLAVITNDGNVFVSDVHDSQVGPVSQISLDPPLPPIPDSQILDSGSITSGLSIGGFARLFISKTGDYTFSGKLVDGGLLGVKFVLTLVAIAPSGRAISQQRTHSVGGTFTPGSDTDSWNIPGFDERIRDNWQELAQARLTWKLEASTSITPEIDKALQDALADALKQAGQAAVKALINLIIAA